MKIYTVTFKTMDGNYHKKDIRANSHQGAIEKFRAGEKGRVVWSAVSSIIDICIK